MAVASPNRPDIRGLDRTFDLARINLDVLAFAALVIVSIVTHLYALDRMALHHDESIHAWMSWKFFTGSGGFSCAGGRQSATYCYDPVYHGPSLYVMTLVSYFLFGDGNWQARIPQAVTGIGLVASCWMLRPYLGNRGAFIAAVLMAFTPSLLYYTRFARHDGLMVLWTLWIVIGFFRWLDTGRPGYLYLLGAGAALAIATHELYYILGFIFGWFLIIRVLFELLPRRQVVGGLAVVFALSLLVEASIVVGAWSGQLTATLRADGLALLFMAVSGMGLLLTRVWDDHPLVVGRAVQLWREQRGALWTALAILGSIYVVLYSTFFADPRGIIDGLYRGLEYWLGSQQEFKRGDQPWYYYFMLMTLYEPLAFFGGLATLVYLFTRGWARGSRGWAMGAAAPVREMDAPPDGGVTTKGEGAKAEDAAPAERAETSGVSDDGHGNGVAAPALAAPVERVATGVTLDLDDAALPAAQPAAAPAAALADEAPPTPRAADPVAAVAEPVTHRVVAMLPLFLAFWFLCSFVTFSWAGEKMPWLNTHIALPANLLVAWGITRLLDVAEWRKADRGVWIIPAALTLLLVALGVALWRFTGGGTDQVAQADRLQGIVPLLIGAALIYTILTIAGKIGWRVTAAACGLTLAALVGLYTLRATWMVVYAHPDTPRDPLVYVQSAPDVPLIVSEIRELAINQTRGERSPNDPIGGLSMPVIMDGGDGAADGEGSLAWPYQWYLRDFQRIEVRDAEFFRAATAESFLVDGPRPESERQIAPVVIVSRQHVNETAREALEANYVKRYDAKLNWWFPEGNKCDPTAPGYKQFYYAYPGGARDALKSCPNINVEDIASPLGPLLWPLDTTHWPGTIRFLLFREIPEPQRLDGREMQVWVRKDLAPVASTAAPTTSSTGTVRLRAAQLVGQRGADLPGDLADPRGVAVDPQGNIYVTDTGNHRITVFAPSGEPIRTIGGFGSGEGQFNEPRGIAVDREGNIYVADTWNARIVKLDPQGAFLASWGEGREDFGAGRRATVTDGTEAGNAAAPLGFFGPRGVAVDAAGNVYIADTGNKRIVVTDAEGAFRYQWGSAGGQAGQFSEPTGVAVDEAGNVYVADTWNGRVQVFPPAGDGRVGSIPSTTWRVPGWQPQTYDDPGIAVAGDRIAVSVPGRSALVYFDLMGQELLRWGGPGEDLASLNLPSGVFAGPDGEVLVADRANARVLRFTLPPLGAPEPSPGPGQ